jgi:uncharacterized protein (DUF1330 family)
MTNINSAEGIQSKRLRREQPVTYRYKIAFAMMAGVGLGAAATQGLHAQVNPPTYVVIAIQRITDAEAYKPLPEKGRAAAEAAGGRYLISTGNITRLDGNSPERLAVIEFRSVEKAQAWYRSAAQKDADNIRAKSTDSVAFIVEGIAR